jgi:hypothetical protein
MVDIVSYRRPSNGIVFYLQGDARELATLDKVFPHGEVRIHGVPDADAELHVILHRPMKLFERWIRLAGGTFQGVDGGEFDWVGEVRFHGDVPLHKSKEWITLVIRVWAGYG